MTQLSRKVVLGWGWLSVQRSIVFDFVLCNCEVALARVGVAA